MSLIALLSLGATAAHARTARHRAEVRATTATTLPTWSSAYDWAGGNGYNGWHEAIIAPDLQAYGLGSALDGQPGVWAWLTGGREYRPAMAEWRFDAPGTTRIASARFSVAYAPKLLAHHCVVVGIGTASALRDQRRDCSPADDPANVTFAAADPDDAPTSTRAVLRVEMPACRNASDPACSKWIPSLDPLVNGPYARLKAIDLTLVDDDLPRASASGPLRDLADQYVDGRSRYDATVSASDAGAGIRRVELQRVGTGAVASFDAPCDPAHNTAALDSAICPAQHAGTTTVDTTSLPEGRVSYRTTAEDLARNTGASDSWSFLVDHTAPPAPEGVGGDLADDSSSATIWWSSNADPDLADGSPGSGTIGEVYRYRVGDGAWSGGRPPTSRASRCPARTTATTSSSKSAPRTSWAISPTSPPPR
jgi:hypothetical protein